MNRSSRAYGGTRHAAASSRADAAATALVGLLTPELELARPSRRLLIGSDNGWKD
jgi:hypothetical protein